MDTPKLRTTQMHVWLRRLRANDPTARDQLFRAVLERRVASCAPVSSTHEKVYQECKKGNYSV